MAQAQTWDGPISATPQLWGNASNWDPDGVPGTSIASPAAVTFNVNTTGTRNIGLDFDPTYYVKSFSFPSTNATFPTTIGATDETGTLVFDNAGNGVSISLSGSTAPSFTAANYINFRAPMVLNEQLTVNVDPRGNGGIALNFIGQTQNVSGTGGVTKNGLGIWAISDSVKTYTGPTIINAGRFRIQPGVANLGGLTGTSSVTVNAGGQLQFDTAGGTTTGNNNNFGPNGDVVINLNGIGVTTPGAALTNFQGAIRVESGRGTTTNNKINLQTTSLINTVNAGSILTLPNVVSGPGGLIHNGGNGTGVGTLNLDGANTYSGGTTTNAGTTNVSGASGLGATTGTLTVNAQTGSNTTVNLSSTAATTTGTLSGTVTSGVATINIRGGQTYTVNQSTDAIYAGILADSGNFTLGSGSTAALTLTNANTYTGNTSVQGGRLQATKAAALPGYNAPGKVSVGANGTLGVNVGASQWSDAEVTTLQSNATFAAGSTLALATNDASATLAAPITAPTNVAKVGPNSVTLTGVSTYTGQTRVNGGTLVIGNADAIAASSGLVANSATAQVGASLPKAVTVKTVSTTGTGQIDMNSGAMVVKGSDLATIQALVVSGYANSAWNGPGINSSVAAADANFVTAVGYASNADAFLTSFQGVTGLDSDDVLIRTTYLGDSDLNGDTNLDDFPLFTAGLEDDAVGGANVLPSTWFYGDYDYNGVVNLDDFPLFTYGLENDPIQLAALADLIESSSLSADYKSAMLGVLSAVPEPGSLGVLGVAACGLAARRRRR